MKKTRQFLRNFRQFSYLLKILCLLVCMLPFGFNVLGNIFKLDMNERKAMILRAGSEEGLLIIDTLSKVSGKENMMLTSGKRNNDPDFERQRADMVESQIQARGIKDKRVLDALGRVPRHLFVPTNLKEQAYVDSALPIGYGQTISQPYIVAFMCEAASILPHEKVLEIGTGSGYQAAILTHLCHRVYTIELITSLGKKAKKTLKESGYHNVHIKTGDGYFGWPEHAPYDVILVTAAAEEVPKPLMDQLAFNGRLIMPIGRIGSQQELVRFIKKPEGLEKESLGPVVFVPFRRGSEL